MPIFAAAARVATKDHRKPGLAGINDPEHERHRVLNVKDGSPPDAPSGVFGGLAEIKTVDALDDPKRKEEKFSDGFFGRIAKHRYFEAATISVIIFNAAEIGWNTDYAARWDLPDNLYDGPVMFITIENFFAVYFTAEIIIRFLAYRSKRSCLRDAWFVFDSFLVAFMVWETWVMPFITGGKALGKVSVLRLLRLLRITRMVRIVRAFPQLMMIIQSIVSASRAVMWVAVLLVIVTFTWSILFTNQFHQGFQSEEEIEAFFGTPPTPEKVVLYFGSMGRSMFCLLASGTLFDNVTDVTNALRSANNWPMLAAFILYILINSFTLLNMLLGILVEVVRNVAAHTAAKAAEAGVKEAITTIFKQMDADNSGLITRDEFREMKTHQFVMEALADLGIKDKQFDKYVDLLFTEEVQNSERQGLSFDDLLETICRLRPGAAVNLLDFLQLSKALENGGKQFRTILDSIDKECSKKDTPTIAPAKTPVSLSQVKLPKHVNMQMIARLENTSSMEMILELQRRTGLPDMDEIPLSMMDEELQRHVHRAQGQWLDNVDGSNI